jgi:hypothetical protein
MESLKERHYRFFAFILFLTLALGSIQVVRWQKDAEQRHWAEEGAHPRSFEESAKQSDEQLPKRAPGSAFQAQ